MTSPAHCTSNTNERLCLPPLFSTQTLLYGHLKSTAGHQSFGFSQTGLIFSVSVFSLQQECFFDMTIPISPTYFAVVHIVLWSWSTELGFLSDETEPENVLQEHI